MAMEVFVAGNGGSLNGGSSPLFDYGRAYGLVI